MKSKKIILPLMILFLTAGLLFITPEAKANGFGTGGNNFISNLIQYISQKFHLDKTQVQSAVKEFRTQAKAAITPRPTLSPDELQAREKTRLDKFVQQGKINADQEKAILDELNVIRTKYSTKYSRGVLQYAPTTDRRKKMQEMQNEIKDWAKSHNIDQSYLIPGFGGMRGFDRRGMREGFGRGIWGRPSVTPAP